jgi:hypothetical protein
MIHNFRIWSRIYEFPEAGEDLTDFFKRQANRQACPDEAHRLERRW